MGIVRTVAILITSFMVLVCVGNFDDRDPCDGVTCSGNGTCWDNGETAQCHCVEGFEAVGLECHPVSTDGDADSDVDGDGDTDADSDGDSDGDTDADSDGDGDGDTDADTDSDGDGDGDTDADTDTDANTDSDGDTDSDVDSDADRDAETDSDGDPVVVAWDDFESGTRSGGSGWMDWWYLELPAEVTDDGLPRSGDYHLRMCGNDAYADRYVDLGTASRAYIEFWASMTALDADQFAIFSFGYDPDTDFLVTEWIGPYPGIAFEFFSIDVTPYLGSPSGEYFIRIDTEIETEDNCLSIDEVTIVTY